VEHLAGDQELAIAESSRAAERTEHAGSTEQHGINQRNKGSVPNADTLDASSSDTMSVVLGVGTDNDNPAIERDVPEVAAIEEEPEIEEIN
jgi:hypothetical protein